MFVNCCILELLLVINLTGEIWQTSVACYSLLAVLKANFYVTSTSWNFCTNDMLQLQYFLLILIMLIINFLLNFLCIPNSSYRCSLPVCWVVWLSRRVVSSEMSCGNFLAVIFPKFKNKFPEISHVSKSNRINMTKWSKELKTDLYILQGNITTLWVRKTRHQTLAHNFHQILTDFILISLTDSVVNLQ